MRPFRRNSQRFLRRHRRAGFRFSARYRRTAGVRWRIIARLEETDIMAKGQQRSNRETKKPKKDKAKAIAAAPSRKEAAWQPDFGPGKKK